MRWMVALIIGFMPVLAWGGAMPSIQVVQQQALSYADLNPGKVGLWERRNAKKNWLPQLRVSVRRDLDEGLNIGNADKVSISSGHVTVGPDVQDWDRSFDAGTSIQVTALWNLDRLLFNREDLAISQERRRRHEERSKLLEKVTHYYFERLAAKDALKHEPKLNSLKKRKLRYLIQDRAARLDALTGGWFLLALKKTR